MLKTTLTEEAASIDKIAAAGLKKDAELFKAAKDLVVPVQHDQG